MSIVYKNIIKFFINFSNAKKALFDGELIKRTRLQLHSVFFQKKEQKNE